MPTPRFTARTAAPSDIEAVLAVSLESFADEAVLAWVIPDPAQRAAHMRESFAASLETAVGSGAVLLAHEEDGEAVAVSIWLERETATPATDEPPAGDTSSAGATSSAEGIAPPETAHRSETARRLALVESATRSRVPTAPHLHLSSMATRPRSRGLGVGTVLLEAGLDRARTRGLPVYLEASTSDNRRLYERRGFRDLGDGIALPAGGPVLQPMWRQHDPRE